MRSDPPKPTKEMQARIELMYYLDSALDKKHVSEFASLTRQEFLKLILASLMSIYDVLTLSPAGKNTPERELYVHATTLGLCYVSNLLEYYMRDYLPVYGERQFCDKINDSSIQTNYLDPALTLEDLNTSNEKLREATSGNVMQMIVAAGSMLASSFFTSFVSGTLGMSVAGIRMNWMYLYQTAGWFITRPGTRMFRNIRFILFSQNPKFIGECLAKLAAPEELTVIPVHLANESGWLLTHLLKVSEYERGKNDNYFYEIRTSSLKFNSLSYFCLLQVLQDCGCEILLTKENSILVRVSIYQNLQALREEAAWQKDKKIGARKGAKVKSANPLSFSAVMNRVQAVKSAWKENMNMIAAINNCLENSPIRCHLKVSSVTYRADTKKIETKFSLIYTINKRVLDHKYFIFDALRHLHEKLNPEVNMTPYDRERMIITNFQEQDGNPKKLKEGLKKIILTLSERIKMTRAAEAYLATAEMAAPQKAASKGKGKADKHADHASNTKQDLQVFCPKRLEYTISTRPMDESRRTRNGKKGAGTGEEPMNITLHGKICPTKRKYLVPLTRKGHYVENSFLFFDKKSRQLRKLKSENPTVYKKLKYVALGGQLGRKEGIEQFYDKETIWVRLPRVNHRLEATFTTGNTDEKQRLKILHVSRVTKH